MFHYCAYWGTWSRELSCNHPQGPIIEVNLTPIPCCYSSTWETDVAGIRIRAHGTSPGEKDKHVAELPSEIIFQMKEKLGEELTYVLLHADLLPMIDWKKYQAKCNGGANLKDIHI